MKREEILFSLLGMEVCGGTVTEETKAFLSEEMLEHVYALAKKHDLAHIAGNALGKLELLGNGGISDKFKRAAMEAIYRYMRIDSEQQKICNALEEAQIPFVPLKGSVLRYYYPEPWMRTSCDIDVLVKEETLDAAANVLVDKLRYERKGRGDHDLSMFAPSGLHIELHYQAVDEGRLPEAQAILENIWNDVKPKADGSFHYCMPDEMFFFFHIVHMAKHIENGGCGIRPFLDLWILNHCVEHDRATREKLLSQGKMLTFAQAAENLSEAWFSGGERGPLSDGLEYFVLDGGVYGNLQNHIAVQQSKQGGKLKYVLLKIFLPYDRIKFHYPILQKHPWLTPLYEVRRWMKLVFAGGVERSLRTMKTNAEISAEKMSATEDLLKSLEL